MRNPARRQTNRRVDFSHVVAYDSIVHISVLPKTSFGRWSVGLAIASILFFALSEVLTGFEVLGPGLNRVLAVALTIVLAGVEGAAFVTGLISMIKSKERSVLVFMGTAIGLWGLIGAAASLVTGLRQI